MALEYYQAFREPSPYEQERLKAERLRRYAELLEQQGGEPEGEFTYQGIRAMPSPAAALGKMLQAYQSKKAREKAEEAERKQTGMEEEAASQIMGRLMGGRTPGTIADLTEVKPTGKIGPSSEADLTGVQLESQYTRSPEDAMRKAMTPQGMGAMRRNPLLAAALQKSMEAPKTAEYGTTPQFDADGRAFVVNKAGEVRYLDGIKKPADAPAAVTPVTIRKGGRDIVIDARTGAELGNAPVAPRDEPLMSIVGPDGKPILARRSQAEGKQPFFATTASGSQLTGEDKVDRRQHRSKRAELQNAYNSVINFVQELKNTPKEESLFGEKAGRLSSKYKLALGAVRVLQNTGVLNPGELPFIEDTLRNPQSISQLFNPASRETIAGQVDSILDLLEEQARVNDEIYGYDVAPLKNSNIRATKLTEEPLSSSESARLEELRRKKAGGG